MKERKYGLFFVPVIILLLVLAAVFVRVFIGLSQQKVRLADGSFLALRGVTATTNAFIWNRTPWQHSVPPFLRNILHLRSSSLRISAGNGDGIRIFLTCLNPTNGAFLPGCWRSADAVDRNGFAYKNSVYPAGINDNEMLVFDLKNYPRRERKFLIRLFDSSHVKLIGEFVIRNPIQQRNVPVWIPDRLPCTKTNGEARVTLKSLKPVGDWKAHSFVPNYDVDFSGADWEEKQWFSDATGNTGDVLSPQEPAWKWHLRLTRTIDDSCPSNIVLRFPIEGIPAPGAFTNINQTRKMEGVTIHLETFNGPGMLLISNCLDVATNTLSRYLGTPVYSVSNYVDGSKFECSILGQSKVDTVRSRFPFFIIETSEFPPNCAVVFRFRENSGRVCLLRDVDPVSGWQGVDTKKSMHDLLRGMNLAKKMRFDMEMARLFFAYGTRENTCRRFCALPGTNIAGGQLEVIVNKSREFEFFIDPKSEVHRVSDAMGVR